MTAAARHSHGATTSTLAVIRRWPSDHARAWTWANAPSLRSLVAQEGLTLELGPDGPR